MVFITGLGISFDATFTLFRMCRISFLGVNTTGWCYLFCVFISCETQISVLVFIAVAIIAAMSVLAAVVAVETHNEGIMAIGWTIVLAVLTYFGLTVVIHTEEIMAVVLAVYLALSLAIVWTIIMTIGAVFIVTVTVTLLLEDRILTAR